MVFSQVVCMLVDDNKHSPFPNYKIQLYKERHDGHRFFARVARSLKAKKCLTLLVIQPVLVLFKFLLPLQQNLVNPLI
ncbi:hypothetical protein FGO68_gene15743 [Halteria grandinella]|uniref:Uncharacterized protein n=1 Tax=Halteria grandinella TaxID=5974 RepID=A0A8J8NG03_HALGN|nr:hypothetical protein FGO68_gene15743 [Halteria grandinella]